MEKDSYDIGLYWCIKSLKVYFVLMNCCVKTNIREGGIVQIPVPFSNLLYFCV